MAKEIKAKRRKLSEYRLDPENANLGSQRGQYLIETSIDRHGAMRSGVATNDDMLYIGNHTADALMNAGIEDVIEVETTGQEWVVVKRSDYASNEIKTKEAAIADNRAAVESINFDIAQLLKAKARGVELNKYWHDNELNQVLQGALMIGKDFKEYDESIANSVEYCTCPNCGHKFPK